MNLWLRLLLLRLQVARRPRVGIWDTVRTPFRVAPTDLDALGHMNNGKFLSIMDLGRLDLMVRSGLWRVFSSRGWYPVVAGQSITYRRSLNPGQRFDLYSRFVGVHDTWVYVDQTFAVGTTVHAHAVVRARFLRKTGGSVGHDELEEAAGESVAGHPVPQWMVDWTAATKPIAVYHPTNGD